MTHLPRYFAVGRVTRSTVSRVSRAGGAVLLAWVAACFAPAPAAKAKAVDVVLLGGQSNMDGRASTSGLPTSPVNLQQPQTNVLYYNGYSGSNGYTSGKLASLAPGPSQFGPEVTFGQKIAADNPGNSYALVKYAVGGTSLAVDWKPPTLGSPSTGPVYASFKSAVTSGLNAITAAGDTYQIVGMLWLQGESDATSTYAAAYQQNLVNFITDVRATYGQNLPFIIGGIGYDGDAADTTTVSAAQASIAATMSNVSYFDDSDLWTSTSPGPLHFDASRQEIIGQRYASSLESVPEPATLGILLPAGLLLMSRRRAGRRPVITQDR